MRRPRPRSPWPIVLLAAACLSAGCADGGPGPATVRDSAGVRIVELPPARTDRRIVLVSAGETGGMPSDRSVPPRPEFSRISAVDVGPQGGIHVLDGLAGRVTVVDPATGRERRRFGRPGEGPGEFRSAGALAVLDDGSVLVGERMPLRLHRFGSDGEIRSSVRLRLEDRPDARPAAAGPAMAEWGRPASGWIPVGVLTLSPDPTRPPMNRLFRAEIDGEVEAVLLEWEEPGSLAEPPPIFSPRRSWTGDPSGRIHHADGRTYEIRTVDGQGRLVRILRRPSEARGVTRDAREAAIRRYRDAMSRGGGAPELVERVASKLRVVRELPAIHGLWTDPVTGELWAAVPEADPERGELSAAEYHVYGPGGDPRGRAPAPAGFELLAVRDRRLYGAYTDAVDVPHLRVLEARDPEREGPAGR